MKQRLTIIVILIVFFSGVVLYGQAQSVDALQKQIVPADEIWQDYVKVKQNPLHVTQLRRQPPRQALPAHIDGIRNRIMPTHEIWQDYAKLPYDISPEGLAERKRKEEEEIAEQQRKEEAKRAVDALLQRMADEKAERDRKKAEEDAKIAAAKAEQDRIEAEQRRQAEARRMAEAQRLAEQRRIEEERRKAAEPVNLMDEFRRSGFDSAPFGLGYSPNVNDLVRYGNDRLKSRLNSAQSHPDMRDPFKKAEAEARVRAVEAEIAIVQAEIARKIFFYECAYDANDRNVKVYGNTSSCKITIWPPFIDRLGNAKPSFPIPNITVDATEIGRSFGNIEISVTGSTDSIRELVRNKDNYLTRIYFANLRYRDHVKSGADILKIEIVKK